VADNKKLWRLVAAHVAVGVTSSALAPFRVSNRFGLDLILLVPLLASVSCQAVLLALWGTNSTSTAPWKRLALLAAGTAFLELLVRPGSHGGEFAGFPTLVVALSSAGSLSLRLTGWEVARRAEPCGPLEDETGGFRFSIRGLMACTVAVALLGAGARELSPGPGNMLWALAVWSFCFTAAGLSALWAGLGGGRPGWRYPPVFVLSAALGVFFAAAVQALGPGWVYILSIMTLSTAGLLASLAVVRSCGYRLRRRLQPKP
jgi:hypothetical protein